MQPAVIADARRLKQLSQEYKQLGATIAVAVELEKIQQQLAQAQQLLVSEQDSDLLTIAQEEVVSLKILEQKLMDQLDEALRPRDEQDAKNAIVEIRGGTGGDEAALFAAELYRMYARHAQQRGWKVGVLSSSRSDIGGFKEIIFEVIGHEVYGDLKYESGVHRVQRVPETEKSGRVHTSTATVAVLPEAEEVDVAIKPEDVRIDVFRSGGHGGQSVNTTDSAVRLTHLPTNTVVTCQDEKSQHQNKEKAFKILRSRLWAAEQERLRQQRSDQRRSQIGTGERSEKIRTYNFPQDRITDHRIKQSWHNIQSILDGGLSQIITTLQKADR